jgi:predicted regulator of Ras-like GTPase activity (Roadblock/LC7/MglB family)
MPYQRLLDTLVRSVDGAQGALLLDANGERVVESGERHERLRLIGAYQGIALARARDVKDRYETGDVRHIVCRYTDGYVISRPLRDGYYLVLALALSANVGQALYRSAEAEERLNAAL